MGNAYELLLSSMTALVEGVEKKANTPNKFEGPRLRPDGSQSNKWFSRTDHGFLQACEAAGIKPTARQASKFRRGYGAACKAQQRGGK